MELKKPYLLFLGDAADPLAAKVAQGIKTWHPEYCVGQYRLPTCNADCGLEDLSIQDAVKAGAQTLVIGVANRGGVISEEWISILIEALEAGLDIASGLHNKLSDIPVLVSNRGGLPETVDGKHSCIVNGYLNPKIWKEKIENFL